jgi:hypothetical protein
VKATVTLENVLELLDTAVVFNASELEEKCMSIILL